MKTKEKTRKVRFDIKPISKARFDKMTPAKQRVTIAKDILSRVEAGQIIEKHGTYVSMKDKTLNRMAHNAFDWGSTEKENKLASSSAQALLSTEPCEACAKGAIALSLIANFNGASVLDAVTFSGDANDLPELPLQDIFPEDMWEAIERAFDQQAIGTGLHKPWSLKSVMKWIIKHKGSFLYDGYIFSDEETKRVGYGVAPMEEPKGLA